MSAEDLVQRIARLSPDTHRIYEEHREPDGYVMEHPFLSDIARLAMDRFCRWRDLEDGHALGELSAILLVIEDQMRHGDEDEDNAIRASFLEMLDHEPGEPTHELRDLLGQRTRRALDDLEGWTEDGSG